MDDMKLAAKRKCHLIEIFPCRYGQSNGHLLFLDKAVYLFMQFVNLKQTTVLMISGARIFLKKCSLLDVITVKEMELKFMEIYKYFTINEYIPHVSGLSFHGFLYLFYYIAQLKFPFFLYLSEQVHHLLEYCDSSLRSNGVRSARLRRVQINHENCRKYVFFFFYSSLKKNHLNIFEKKKNHLKYNTLNIILNITHHKYIISKKNHLNIFEKKKKKKSS
ncbi:unnamed protein product [Brugia pahangi]|uniref:Uncharacterized protein n=1 Tax=Brugia pahangi TaxID=6280 RepID=A0A0N4TAA9_BRUPA|nr:unnamed protein product [Brugia pahangi]